MKIDIADLDCVYLSYDEPQKEKFWVQIQNIVPWAKRVDGVKGSDAAHKACADVSETERFVLIDGDNIPDAEFFDQQLDIDDSNKEAVFRWRARNHINGLRYGNGGLSCWTKKFVQTMRTHENSDGDDSTAIEFCFDANYWPMKDCWSTTYPNGSEEHAWRAGFREGVKMCLDRGTKPELDNFKQKAHRQNLDNLAVWHTVGRDVEFGKWAIAGARQGTVETMIKGWDYKEVQCFDKLNEIWHRTKDSFKMKDEHGLGCQELIDTYTPELVRLNMKPVELDAEQSKFFKYQYGRSEIKFGIMVRE